MTLQAWTFDGEGLVRVSVDWNESRDSWDGARDANGFTWWGGEFGPQIASAARVNVYRRGETDEKFEFLAELSLGDSTERVFLTALPALLSFLRYIEPVIRMAQADEHVNVLRHSDEDEN